MSNIYIQEPPTNGKVMLITTVGDIDIELWSKEAPKACRNFVQLCMEGYYDGTIFHRVVKDFIVQGGDPTGSGHGGESIYGQPFKDEIHTRLRFVRRGLVAMANSGPNDNGSQFFFTMGPTQELQGKHTIFGKVTGKTVYNMLKLQDCDVDHDERPTFPNKIKRTEILSNPFEDIVPRLKEQNKTDNESSKNNKTQMKGTNKSSHDLIDDPKLSSVPAVDVKSESSKKKKKSKAAQKSDDDDENDDNDRKSSDDIERASRNEELRREVKELQRELKRKKEEKTVEKSKKFKVAESKPENDMVAEYQAEKQKYVNMKKQSKKGSSREEMTLAMLSKFQTKLRSASILGGNYDDDEEETKEESEEGEKKEEHDDVGDFSWMRHKLIFENEAQKRKVIDANVAELDRYEIFDPRNPLTQRRREASKQALKDKR
ncbi:hypothetical protein KUTeg_016087 [Tegillarca granosa]|uniref:Spliceosome-associated protein CWC27 homolog n=1 Tax=Tegillarca granosa TaxID=220873 RepID=A0ABQ9EJT8_TEGGR|nr:hypothetical protein KUTeg_016087 [Tegillarca granosa]